MPRPSLKEERTEQVLQAFQKCVARYGLDGSSLERIAEESGLQRSLVRHFVGNRTDLVHSLAARVIEQSDLQWQLLIEQLPETNAVDTLLQCLFFYKDEQPETMLIVSSLISAAVRDDVLKKAMQKWFQQFVGDIEKILQRDFSTASKEDIHNTAFGIVSLYLNLDSLTPLDLDDHYRPPAHKAATKLVSTLKETESDTLLF
ncbi:TetR/AcrR family transcriptional regulator [Sansalvadorimonas sp. 2012CJ34-2]|uniref:TetR/AcrR family transcriptional regulator n=1 Tax=Parendozoicomonas callyspongiae TaxID=2942213 RepID=A0ABT0PB54_9GAMM|nr:TetR/AcrR family transcriptional regulator [Sansalvadorimonas sp. 2012CJ34-2]MCL6268617.1 TetR/AcrR family transcriptional regulator [Sansalvadorimonas sp. 2012CJ34-2]